MILVFIISGLLSLSSFAEELHPPVPDGWVEMNSIEPVILTWVKAMPEKNLEEVPTLMVQQFKNENKIKDFILKNSKDQSGCFKLEAKGWQQTWCERKSEVFVTLSRGDSVDLKVHQAKLKSWILSHD